MRPVDKKNTVEIKPGDPVETPINRRQLWANNRFQLETDNIKTKRFGGKRRHHWYALLLMMKIFVVVVKVLRLYKRGYRNAFDLQYHEETINLPELPEAFDGFKILHLSDLHLDGMPGLDSKILELIDGKKFDLCVLTGDYRNEIHGTFKKVMDSLRVLTAKIESKNGIVAVLGNHDDCHMVEPMEAMGIRMLINEKMILEKDGQLLQIVGTDDPHYYYTDQALHILEQARNHFTIALIHSPELYEEAAAMGVNLYLCGHTHGGQVCLPGGYAPIRHLNKGRQLFVGRWKHKNMTGITNTGAGTSGIPVRFNTRGEVLSLTLRPSRV